MWRTLFHNSPSFRHLCISHVARAAFERLFLLGKVFAKVRRMIEDDSRSTFVGPCAKVGMIRGKTLETLLVARLAGHVVNRRQVRLRSVMFSVASGTRHIPRVWRRGLIADGCYDLALRSMRTHKTR